MKYGALLLLIWLASPTIIAQTLDELIGEADPFTTIPTQELEKLVKQLAPLENQATPQQQWVIDLLKMRYLAITGDNSASLQILKQLDIPSIPPAYRMRAYTIAILIYQIQNKYVEAFKILNKIQRLLPKIKHPTLRYIANSLAPEIYSDAGDYDKALLFALSASKEAKKTHNTMNICTSLDAIGSIYQHRGETKKGEKAYRRMLDICTTTKDPLFIGMARNGLAASLLQQHKYQAALAQANKALDLCHAANYNYGIVLSQLTMAQIYYQMGNNQLADHYLDVILPQAKDYLEHLQDIYTLKKQISKDAGNYKTALKWLEKQRSVEKQAIDQKKNIRIAQLTVAFEVKNKEQHIEQLKKENQLLTLQKKNNHQQFIIIMLSSVSIFLIVLLLWLQAHKERRRFKRMSQVDGLTQLYNQAYVCTLAETIFEEHHRDGKPFSVVVADIDWFKRVNDTYGHAAGDKVLQTVAKVLRNCFGTEGIVGRTGGEEFTAFFPGMSVEQTRNLIENCSQQLKPVAYENHSIEVTLSFGIAISRGEYETLNTLIRDADSALYKAKRNGRNQYQIYHMSDLKKAAT
ncbi:tetratricopeptide repeat-containing diguanylate cyclase [Thiolapillus brandeum]|uniref:diguanylate cyclase n=1 Tax=Thiolapillus brandeum TaxID=1076588 RepID=A0A7U6GI88_9GAMM|nr:diguanylate cyclase [Thiolapillus brandeum]BAO44115.1 conserved hypothetical protein [Thiolapillus brandeum]